MSLNLQPNEIVGYRIKPDWYSFNVVLVKRHGATSKNAGKEYDTPLAYCKSLAFATQFILGHATRVRGELNQRDQEAVDGSVADAKALQEAFVFAQVEAMKAVAELQARIDALGLPQKGLVQALGAPEEHA